MSRKYKYLEDGLFYRDLNNEDQTQYNVDEALDELEELKKRDAGMKLTQVSRFTTDKKLYGVYACSSCREVIPYITLNSKRVKPKFCYHCGQRLDWSDGKNDINTLE